MSYGENGVATQGLRTRSGKLLGITFRLLFPVKQLNMEPGRGPGFSVQQLLRQAINQPRTGPAFLKQSPLHVVSAWASEQGLVLGQRCVGGKSNSPQPLGLRL